MSINGPRGWGLLALGVTAIVRGVAYLPSVQPSSVPGALARLSGGVPLWVYAILWLTVGALSIAEAFRHPHPVTGIQRDRRAVAGQIGMWSIWGYSYLTEYLIQTVELEWPWLWHWADDRSYLNAATYLGPAFLIWSWSLAHRPRPAMAVVEGPVS